MKESNGNSVPSKPLTSQQLRPSGRALPALLLSALVQPVRWAVAGSADVRQGNGRPGTIPCSSSPVGKHRIPSTSRRSSPP